MHSQSHIPGILPFAFPQAMQYPADVCHDVLQITMAATVVSDAPVVGDQRPRGLGFIRESVAGFLRRAGAGEVVQPADAFSNAPHY